MRGYWAASVACASRGDQERDGDHPRAVGCDLWAKCDTWKRLWAVDTDERRRGRPARVTAQPNCTGGKCTDKNPAHAGVCKRCQRIAIANTPTALGVGHLHGCRKPADIDIWPAGQSLDFGVHVHFMPRRGAVEWTWWQGYVTQLANGTQLPQPDVTMARPASSASIAPRPSASVTPPSLKRPRPSSA